MLFNDLALFTTVAARLSFSAAADQLGVPLSKVSRRIADLERHLGVRLFERTTRRVRLTEEGRRLLDRCQAPIEALRDVSGLMEDTRRQIVRVTAPPRAARTTVGMRLLDFAERRPELVIEMTTTNNMLDFFRDNVDLAFRLGPLDDSSLVSRRLWSVPYAFAAGQAFADAYELGAPVRFERLIDLPALMSHQPWALTKRGRKKPSNVAHVFDDLDLLRDAVRRDLGVAMLPREMIEPPLREVVLLDDEPLQREMHAVYPSRRLLPTRVRDLIDFMARAAGD